MSDKFDWIDPETEFVICPEGLNAFYWHKNNEPVACWMTKRHRYDEIIAFTLFLDKLYAKYCHHIHQDTQIILFGFSQGCATLWRWIHASQPRVDALINWAGWIPEDIGYKHLRSYIGRIKLYLHYGTLDEFITEESFKKIQDVIDINQLDIHISTWAGKHHIPKEELTSFFEQHHLRKSANLVVDNE